MKGALWLHEQEVCVFFRVQPEQPSQSEPFFLGCICLISFFIAKYSAIAITRMTIISCIMIEKFIMKTNCRSDMQAMLLPRPTLW